MITFALFTRKHAESLWAFMRQVDRAEVEAQQGPFTADQLYAWCGGEDSFVALDGDLVVCAFGCTPHPNEPWVGVPWMLGTDLVALHKKTLVQRAGSLVRVWATQFKQLTNLVSASNKPAILLLRRLGFKFHPGPVGAFDGTTPFLQFVR